jgi:hypothetical protein
MFSRLLALFDFPAPVQVPRMPRFSSTTSRDRTHRRAVCRAPRTTRPASPVLQWNTRLLCRMISGHFYSNLGKSKLHELEYLKIPRSRIDKLLCFFRIASCLSCLCLSTSSNANTALAWNKKVPHILASCTAAGETSIWDLRQKVRRAVLSRLDSSRLDSTRLALFCLI